MKFRKPALIVGAVLLLVVILALLVQPRPERVTSSLPDGTSYRLVMAVYTNQYSYQRRYLPDRIRPLAPLIPDILEEKFLRGGGSIGMGSGGTNLMIVIEASNDRGTPRSVRWMRIRDDLGNSHDGNSLRGTLSGGGVHSLVFLPHLLPNRSKNLSVELLVRLDNGSWTNIGPFSVSHPDAKNHPQWVPEPLPQDRSTNGLTATLIRFESGTGSPSVTGDAPVSDATPKSVRLDFAFSENGQPTDQHRVHWVSLADATGNKWEPHLDPIRATSNAWATNGSVEFVGGVWPGEDAWKVQLESIRTTNFLPEEIWEVPPITLPTPDTHLVLTNEFVVGETTNLISHILAPGVQITNRWQWSVRYWGNEPSVYPISLELLNIGRRRPIILEAKSESGADFKIINHQNVNYPMQSIFVQPPAEGAKELHLKIAFPTVNLFEYIARPRFVDRVPTGLTGQ